MKKYIFFMLIFLLIIGYFVFSKISDKKNYQVSVITSSSSVMLSETDERLIDISVSNTVKKPVEDNVNSGLIDKVELDNLRAWDATRGNFSKAELDEYGRLSPNLLEELAKQGDLKAIQTLAVHEEIAGNHERSIELWNLAAVNGSTKALIWLSSVHEGNYIYSRNDNDAVEALSYLNAAAKRGDLFSKYRHIDSFYKTNGFNPTEEQLKIIDSRSDKILKDLQNKRTELGLPEFDNSPAPELQRIFEALNRS